jgi:hypothetical protein
VFTKLCRHGRTARLPIAVAFDWSASIPSLTYMAACRSSGVEIRISPSDAEVLLSELAIRMIDGAIVRDEIPKEHRWEATEEEIASIKGAEVQTDQPYDLSDIPEVDDGSNRQHR